jgi:large subunit ribosomal protein L19
MNLVDLVNQQHQNTHVANMPIFRTGDTVAVHARITEGAKTRIQVFQGVVIAIKNRQDINGHFRVRKMSSGVGVERVFPFHSPSVEKVEIVQMGKTRKSKLYYLRHLSGKGARIHIDYDRMNQTTHTTTSAKPS